MQTIDNNLNENEYGHNFIGETILLLWLDEIDTTTFYKNVRGGKETYIQLSLDNVSKDMPVVDHIYIFSKEAIFKTLIKDFHWSSEGCYFTMYGMKARYYALDSLQDYNVLHKESSGLHPYLLLQKAS